MRYELSTFRVQPSAYLRQLGLMYLRDHWPWLSLPPLACLVAAVGLGDVRWLVVGAMILFMVIPMILTLSYINYALSMEARWSLLDKSVILDSRGLVMRFADERMHDRWIRRDEVSGVRIGGEAFLVMLTVRRYTFLMIPFEQVEHAGISLRQFAHALTFTHDDKARG